MKTLLLLTAIGLVSLTGFTRAEEMPKTTATLFVALFQEDGTPAAEGELFLYNVDQKTFRTLSITEAAVQLELEPGRYRLYSALAKPMGDHVARYSSPEAKIHLANRDSESVVLRLRLGEDPMTQLSQSTLHKVGLSDDFSTSTN